MIVRRELSSTIMHRSTRVYSNKFLTFPEFTREYILNAVSKCPAAGHGLKLTKCPAVRNIHRIPTEILNQT